MLTNVGDQVLSKMVFQDDQTIIAGAANFYIGLCNQVPAKTDVLADVTTEPSAAGGYARIALARDSTDWPTFGLVNGEFRIQSIIKTFTASGADFDKSFTRLFLCDAASGSVGNLIAFTGAYSSAITILDGDSESVKFEFYP